jgi:hypothetical protein
MSTKKPPKKNAAAQSLAAQRWKKQTAKQRSAYAAKISAVRWGAREHCPCGEFTVERAAARNHKCEAQVSNA